jgi:hypothetical protein
VSAKNRKTRKGESSKAHRRAHRGTGTEQRRRERAARYNRLNGKDEDK